MIGDRLKQLRTENGLTQPAFAALAGTTKQYVSQLEGGINKDPNPKFIEAWAKKFRVRMEWITTGALPREAVSGESDWTSVLAYSQAVGLGNGPEAMEYAETNKLMFRHDSLAKKRLSPKNLRVMYGAGDSMEPTIRERDAILFDVSDTAPRNRGIYVILVPGAGAEEYQAKRYIVTKGEGFFVSDNIDGDHNWKDPRPADNFKIIGRVRWTGGWVS